MSILLLIFREILHRKLRFSLGVLAVAIAAGTVTAAWTALKLYDRDTEVSVSAKEADVKEQMDRLQDDSRKITKDMGFNLQIVPSGQALDPFASDYASLDMPYDYAVRIARARPGTVNHVLPVLEHRMEWSVAGKTRTIFLIGITGEIYIQNQKQLPILNAVPPGKLVIATPLAKELNLTVGQEVEVLGEKFTIHQLLPPRDDKDRDTIWMPLDRAQHLLGKPDKINGILALECGCDADRLPKIKKEIGDLLPGTEVYQFTSKANTRADVRNLTAHTALAALKQEEASRAELRGKRQKLFELLVPLVIGASAVWIAVLTLGAVRERRVEIAILRALGVRSWRILTLFLGNAAFSGILGAGLGYVLGLLTGSLFNHGDERLALASAPFNLMLPAAILIAAPLLACLAAWLPALWAARQEPAQILCEE